jgi:hypothetical protein
MGLGTSRSPLYPAAATAWYDLVGRYNGRMLEHFDDGNREASHPFTEALLASQEQLLNGARIEDGNVVRNFYGEREIATIWMPALTDKEVPALSQDSSTPNLPKTRTFSLLAGGSATIPRKSQDLKNLKKSVA